MTVLCAWAGLCVWKAGAISQISQVNACATHCQSKVSGHRCLGLKVSSCYGTSSRGWLHMIDLVVSIGEVRMWPLCSSTKSPMNFKTVCLQRTREVFLNRVWNYIYIEKDWVKNEACLSLGAGFESLITARSLFLVVWKRAQFMGASIGIVCGVVATSVFMAAVQSPASSGAPGS